jgi:hypothetical protein
MQPPKTFLSPPSPNPYSDQTGRFPVRSSRGNQYVFILYDFDSNVILSHPLHNRQAKEITNAWTTLDSQLRMNGANPALQILDNECSDELKKAFKKYDIQFQLVCRNAAERAIQT